MRTIVCSGSQVHQGPLILVNRAHPLQMTVPPVLEPPDKQYPEILLEPGAARYLRACCKASGEGIVPVSGWRSQDEQQAIWDDTLAKEGPDFTRQYVARPGCSEHQTGLAIDLGKAAPEIDFIRPDFPDSGVCGRFRRLAAEYGFILRYPKGKEDCTGIAWEPWHFRWVGPVHAMLMEMQGLCLEEYLSLLRERPQKISLHGSMARVFYVPASGDAAAIRVPEARCHISGDNSGGFIVTAF